MLSVVQDITPAERVQADAKADRDVTVFGYLRGTNLKLGSRVHIAGVGDYQVVPSFQTQPLSYLIAFVGCPLPLEDSLYHQAKPCPKKLSMPVHLIQYGVIKFKGRSNPQKHLVTISIYPKAVPLKGVWQEANTAYFKGNIVAMHAALYQ